MDPAGLRQGLQHLAVGAYSEDSGAVGMGGGSGAPPGPYDVSCVATFEGKAGDADGTGSNADSSVWTGGQAFIDRDSATFAFSLRKAEPPQVGTLTIQLTVDHPAGIDGPGGDEIMTSIQVVP